MRLSVIARLAPLLVTLPLLGEPMAGLTSTGALVGFDSGTPGTFTSGPTAISGVTSGYTVVAIDRRPATGQLYALTFNFAAVGTEMQVYTVNETTGFATALGTAFAAPRAIGSTLSAATRFGFDIDPVNDVLRVVSTGRDNFRVSPVTGAVVGSDTILTPAGTQVPGAAYSNNVSGATSTTLYAIDTSTNPDQLVFIGGNPVPPNASPNGGVTTIVGSLSGLDTSAGDLGFEITSSGTAFSAMSVSGTSGLYTINLGSGATTLIGTFQGGAIVTGVTSGVGLPAPPSEPMVGLTSTSALVGFNSAAPGTFTSGPTAITGVTAGYSLVSIDRRPATGQLYALAFNFAAVGTEMQVYIIHEAIGVATPLGSAFAAPRAIGSTLSAATRFGFDFDPVNDVMRVVSTGRDNFRVSPITGAVVGSDTILTPAATQVPGAAYSNNVSGATSTTLYAIDAGATPDQLIFIGGNPVPPGGNPNGGVATAVGPLGPETSAGELGFEITSSGNALAAMSVSGTSGLYTVNLGTGTTSLIGTFQGGAIVTGLTSAFSPPAPPSESLVGLTSTNALVGFNSAAPGTFTSGPTAITGITAGYSVVAIDRRPATGQLYALAFNFAAVGTEMQVYTVNETTGFATALGSPFAAPRAIGSTLSAATRFGFDFDPVNDVMRVISTGRDNFRVNPTGTIAGSDTILTPAGTQTPGAAYSNNISGATSTTLYAIDTGATPDRLVFIGGNPVPPNASPNGGVTTAVGPLGPETSAGDLGFEITSSGNAFTAMSVGGTSGLYTVSLGTGAASFIGTFQGGATVTGLTSAVLQANVSGTKTVSGTFTAGGTITYTVVLTNTGSLAQADNVGNELTDVLPSSLTLVSAMATSGTATATIGTNTVTWNGSLAPGSGSVTITITATINQVPGGTVISNQGSISYDTEGNGSNEASALTDDPGVGGAANPTNFTVMGPIVTGTKTASGTFVVGSTVTYTIVLSNSGNAAAPNNATDEFTDVLPAGLTLVSANATSGTAVATIPTRTVTWNGSIPASGSVTITITATINSGTGGTTLTNQGTFAYDADLNGTNETTGSTDDPGTGTAGDGTSILVAGVAIDAVNKSVSGTFVAGSNVTYTIIINNTGDGASADNPGNELTDVLPPELTLVSANATSGTAVATVGTNTVTWNGSVPAAGSVTITITATINDVPPGTPVSNQATHSYDSDANGTNDATVLSNDPSTAAPNDPTIFVVAVSPVIPTLSELGLLLFAFVLALVAAKVMKG